MQPHAERPDPVHGARDEVREEGGRVLQRLVQQQLVSLHRPVLHDVLKHHIIDRNTMWCCAVLPGVGCSDAVRGNQSPKHRQSRES